MDKGTITSTPASGGSGLEHDVGGLTNSQDETITSVFVAVGSVALVVLMWTAWTGCDHAHVSALGALGVVVDAGTSETGVSHE